MSVRENMLEIVEDLTSVVEKIEEVLEEYSSKSSRRMRQGTVSCTWFEAKISSLVDFANQTSMQAKIKSYTASIVSKSVEKCSDVEKTLLNTHKASLELTIDGYEEKLYTDAMTFQTRAASSGEFKLIFIIKGILVVCML